MLHALYEQYRPTQWRDVVGQDKTLKRIDVLRRRGLSGRAFIVNEAHGLSKRAIRQLLVMLERLCDAVALRRFVTGTPWYSPIPHLRGR